MGASSDHAGQNARGQLQVEDAAEEEKRADGDGDCEERVANRMERVERARDEPEEQDRCDDEAGGFGEEEVQGDTGGDEGNGAPVSDGWRVRRSMNTPSRRNPPHVRLV